MKGLRSRFWLAAVAVWLACACAWANDGDKFFDQTLGDYRDELKAARKEGKLGILLMFEAEGCPYCLRMRQQILSRKEVQTYFRKHFATYAVDANGDLPIVDPAGNETTEKAFARSLKVRGTPSFVAFGGDGREIFRLSGAAKTAEEFMRFGRYLAEGHYKTVTIDQYLAAASSGKLP